MSVPSGPDVEWVRDVLSEGDRVGVAEFGRLLYVGVVLRRTPKRDTIKTAPRLGCGPNETFSFYGRHRYEERIGRQIYGCRYLVKPEDKP